MLYLLLLSLLSVLVWRVVRAWRRLLRLIPRSNADFALE